MTALLCWEEKAEVGVASGLAAPPSAEVAALQRRRGKGRKEPSDPG